MPANQEYDRPPITEAIIDFRVAPCPNLSLETLKQLCDEQIESFPDIKPMIEATGTMHVGPEIGATASAQQKQIGYRAISSDGKYVCQRQLGGFTFSRLAPYEGWVPFRKRAMEFWCTYQAAAKPQEVTRVAVRYINRIDIPITASHPTVELKDYFRTGPEVSSDLPQTLAGFFMQLQLPQDDISAQVIINQAIVPPSSPGVISVILDLDLFRDHAVPDNKKAMLSYLEKIRNRKNDLFESCVTDLTRGLFT